MLMSGIVIIIFMITKSVLKGQVQCMILSDSIFRVWETSTWSCEKWSTSTGRCKVSILLVY